MGDPHMIPGADMFNHDPNKQSVQIGTDGEEHFVMKTVSAPGKAGLSRQTEVVAAVSALLRRRYNTCTLRNLHRFSGNFAVV